MLTGPYNTSTSHYNPEHAIAYMQESVARMREAGDIMGTGTALVMLGGLIRQHRDDRQGRILLAEGARLCYDVGVKLPLPGHLMKFAELAAEAKEREKDVRAVRLYAAAEALLSSMSTDMTAFLSDPIHEQVITALRARLDETTFAAAWAEGKAMTLAEAYALAWDEGTLSAV